MAESPSRPVSFAGKTVEAVDGDLDEISNEDVTCEVITQSTAHVGTGIISPARLYFFFCHLVSFFPNVKKNYQD